jgi:phosphatidate cytidylyltransferase
MLGTRIVTAVTLLFVLFAVLAEGGSLGWNVFVLVFLLGAFWEWAKLGRFGAVSSTLFAACGCLVCALMAWQLDLQLHSYPVLALSCVFWVVFAPWCLKYLSLGIFSSPPLYLAAGFVLIASAGLALILAKANGMVFLLSTVAICFAADIFAYVFGKILGKRKLAPSISPGKSWEGAVGGALSVLALSWLVVFMASDFPVLQSTWQVVALDRWHPVVFSLWLVVLSAYSVVGDLFESMLKRQAGVKDSSSLLPGHGGVLDRIDAQLPVLPLAMLLVSSITN